MLMIPIAGFLIAICTVAVRIRLPSLRIRKSESREQKVQILDQWLTRIHRAGKFNGAVLLAKGGDTVFAKCYGDDGADPPVPLTLQSSFNLASVSKHVTAYCILLLKHRGMLRLQDPLNQYIPEMSQYPQVRIKHLLHHTSGLPDYMALARKARFGKPVFTIEDMLQLFASRSPKPEFAPGDKFQYSNTGYVLLAEIVSRVSGMSFDAFCQSELFEPLGMKHTRVFNLLSDSDFDGRVFGFKRTRILGRRQRVDLNPFDGVAGDGAVYSSIEDLKVWHGALSQHALLPEEISRQAYQSGSLNNGTPTHYGYGWLIGPDGGVEHAGGWQGFTSYLHRNTKNGDLVVLLDNSANLLRVTGMGFRFHSIGVNLRGIIGCF